jgi:hypothetical protein
VYLAKEKIMNECLFPRERGSKIVRREYWCPPALDWDHVSSHRFYV